MEHNKNEGGRGILCGFLEQESAVDNSENCERLSHTIISNEGLLDSCEDTNSNSPEIDHTFDIFDKIIGENNTWENGDWLNKPQKYGLIEGVENGDLFDREPSMEIDMDMEESCCNDGVEMNNFC